MVGLVEHFSIKQVHFVASFLLDHPYTCLLTPLDEQKVVLKLE